MGVKRDDAGLTTGYRVGIGVNVLLICALGTALAIGLVVGVRRLSYRQDLRFDVTADRVYALDPLAKQLLRDLESPLEVMFTWGYDSDILERVKDHQGNPRTDLLNQWYYPILYKAQEKIARVLHEWEQVSPLVKITVLHQEREPVRTEELARDLGLSTQEILNKVILRTGGRRRDVPLRRMMVDMQWGYMSVTPGRQRLQPRDPRAWAVQEELTRSLRAVMAGETIPIGIVKGLGGRIEPGTPEYSIFAGVLQGEGYDPVPFELRPGTKVPERVKAVIVPAPRTPLTIERSKILEEYEARGGRLLVVATPRLPERYGRLLEKYGATFVDAVVQDPQNINTLRGSAELESTDLCVGNHVIIASLKKRVTLYLGLCRPLKISADRAPGARAVAILGASAYAKAAAVAFDPASGEMKVVSGRIDNHPKAHLGAALTRPGTDNRQARIVVLGSAGTFRPDVMMQATLYGNRDLVLNSLMWLTDRQVAIGRTPRTGIEARYVNPERLKTPITMVGVVILPLLAGLVGVVVFYPAPELIVNVKTTLVLLVLLGLGLGAWVLFLDDGKGTPGTVPTGKPLFEGFLVSDASRITIADGTGKHLATGMTLVRTGAMWTVKCDAIAGGHEVRARTAVAEEILGAVQALTPLRTVDADPDAEALLKAGLGERRRLRVTVDGPDMEPIAVDFGAEIGPGELICRGSNRPHVFVVAKELLRKLVPEARNVEDPAVLHVSVLDLVGITAETKGRPVFEVRRDHARWFVKRPFAEAPADDERCDVLRAGLLGLSIRRRIWDAAEAKKVLPEPAKWKVTLTTADGSSHVVHLGPRREDGLVAARVDGQGDVVLVQGAVLELLDKDWGHYRDRHLLGLPTARILSLTVKRPEGRPFRLRRYNVKGFHVSVQKGKDDVIRDRFGDEVAVAAFLDKLQDLELTSFDATEPAFEPEFAVDVLAGAAGGKGTETYGFVVGPADANGSRHVRVKGQAGTGSIPDDSVAFLAAPYWTLYARRILATDAYFRFGKVRVKDGKGREARFKGSVPGKQQDLVLERVLDSGGTKVVPEQIRSPFVRRLIGELSVAKYVGEGVKPAMGFDKPHLEVHWFEPTGATDSKIPETDEGTWRSLRVGGTRLKTGEYHAIVDGPLELVFLVEPGDLFPFFTLLEFE